MSGIQYSKKELKEYEDEIKYGAKVRYYEILNSIAGTEDKLKQTQMEENIENRKSTGNVIFTSKQEKYQGI